MTNEQIMEAYQPAIWRMVHVNHKLPGSFYTIQMNDYRALEWHKVKEHQELLIEYSKYDTLKLGSIGDAYGEWRRDIMPVPYSLFSQSAPQGLEEAQAKTNTKVMSLNNEPSAP